MSPSPTLIAAGIALAFVAYVLMIEQGPDPSASGAITADDDQGGWADLGGLASEAMNQMTPDNFSNPTALSSDGLQQLMGREGFSATPYSDFKGSSIGYGHLILAGESFDSITQEQGAQLLAGDVSWAEAAVRSNVKAPIQQCQFDALVSLCFNIGAPAFAKSTLVKKINDYDQTASAQFDVWVKAGGQVNAGLVQRRASERQQYESA
jgi:lysozyme